MADRLAITASLFIRLATGLLAFVMVARGLGPATYGLVATVFAFAGLVSLLTDFGLGAKTLRDAAADRTNGGDVLNASLSVKVYLTALAVVLGGVVVPFLPVGETFQLATLLLGGAILIGTVGDLALIPLRAIGLYRAETLLTAWTSAIHLGVIAWASLGEGDLLLLSACFLGSRLLYATVSILRTGKAFSAWRPRLLHPQEAWTTVRSAWGWAADSGLGYLNGQLDALIVPTLFGMTSAGLYQSSSRFVQAAFTMSGVLSGVHVPRLAKSSSTRLRWKVVAEFAGVGLFFAAFFLFTGKAITRVALGPGYEETERLWPVFAVFAFSRYLAAGLGCVLAAEGRPLVRVAGQITGLCVAGGLLLSPLVHAGYTAVPLFMAGANLATSVIYAAAFFHFTTAGSSRDDTETRF